MANTDAKVIAKAWSDAVNKARLEASPRATVSEYMEFALRSVDTRLIDEAARRRLYERVGHYPQEFAQGTIMFECRLAEASDVVDVSFRFSSLVGNKGAILGVEVAGADAGAERWRAAQAFLRQTAHDGSGLWRRIDNFWLEFDAEAAAPGFFCILKAEQDEDLPTKLETALQLIDGLAGGKAERSVRENVAHLFSQLRPEEPVVWMAWMFGRTSRAIRLCVDCSSVRAALDLLERLDLHETVSQAAPVLGPYEKLASVVTLALDVCKRISSRVGFELRIFRELDDSGSEGSQMLAVLEEQDLCTPEKGRALRRYPSGGSRRRGSERRREVRNMSSLASLLARSLVCVRSLNLHAGYSIWGSICDDCSCFAG